MMAKIICFGLLLFFFSSPMARLSNNVSEQDILNSVAEETDTIFVGRVLRQMEIKDGLVYDSGDSMSLAILEVEVLKTYRGKETNNKKQVVCTWFGGNSEFYFNPSVGLGREHLFFGIQVGSIIQLPAIHLYSIGVPEDESLIYKALKINIKKIKDKMNILATFYDGKVIRNACNEPIVWPEK